MPNVQVIEQLVHAWEDEWVAYYQYTVAALFAFGPTRDAIVDELEEHAEDEHRHAEMLADRLVTLRAETALPRTLDEFASRASCGPGRLPEICDMVSVLRQIVQAERCAIRSYRKLYKLAKTAGDVVTAQLALKILKDEEEHKTDVSLLIDDLPV